MIALTPATAYAEVAFTILLAYLIGAIPFGYLVARWHGVDIFQHGSGNIGATNVGRVLGKRLGILVFVLDFAKGALPTALARWCSVSVHGDTLAVVAGLAAILGHMFPVYLRLRGGKGVATGAGVVFVLLWLEALGALLAWIALLAAFRYVSLASLGAAVALCLLRSCASEPLSEEHILVTGFCLLAAGLVFVRHRANIARLLRGTENRLPDTFAMLTFTKTVHVLALGLWFGTVVFFLIVGLSIFPTFERLTALSAEDRPYWLPVAPALEKRPPSTSFPDPLRKEQGSRLFGRAVGPLFGPYFVLQGVCGLLVLGTALGWSRSQAGRVHKLRTVLLALVLATVAVGWWLDSEVSARRDVRELKSDIVLLSSDPVPANVLDEANAARRDFGLWHTYSLLANFATLVLVAVAMALAAQLPAVDVSGAHSETKVETAEESS